MSVSGRSILVRLRVEMGQAKKAFSDLGGYVDTGKRKLTEFDRSLSKNQQSWNQVGTSMVRTGAALLAASAFAGRAAVQWESAFTGVRKTVNGTEQDFAQLEAGLRGLARSMPETHQEIAGVAEAAGQLGVATKDIVGFTRVMVMLGDSTNLTSQEAATSIAQLMNIMGTAPKNVSRLGATIAALGNKGASTEKQIVDMAQRIAGAGRIVGLSEANVLSLANAVASTGTEAELGGTAISQTLIKIQKAVSTNSTDLQTWASTAGMSAQAFTRAWKKDPAAAFTAFERGLNKQGTKAFLTLSKVHLSGQRTTQVLLNLAGANEKLAQSFRDGDVAWQQNTALVKEAEQRYNTTEAKIRIAWNQIKDSAIDAGADMLPVIDGLAKAVHVLTEAFGLLPSPVVGALGVLTGISGVSLLAVGGLIKLASSIVETRKAMERLELAGATGSAAVVGLARKAAAAAITLTVAYEVLGKIADIGVDAVPKTNQFAAALLKVAQNGKAVGNLNKLTTVNGGSLPLLGSPARLKGLADAFNLVDSSWEKGLSHLTPYTDSFNLASDAVQGIDQALESLVSSGAADQAAEAFKAIQVETGRSRSELLNQLPQYKEALTGVTNEAKATKQEFANLSGGSDFLAQRLASLSSDPKQAAKMLQKLQEDAHNAASSFFDFDEALKLPSLDSFIADMEKAVTASQNWGENILKAAQMGVDEGLIKEFEKAGPAGAQMLDNLVHGSQSQIDHLNEIFGELGGSYAALVAQFGAPLIAQFKTAGAPGAIKTAVEVSKKYGLAKGDVVAILTALDYSTPTIEKVLEALGLVQDTNPSPKITAKDAASSTIKAILKLLGQVKDVNNTVTTTYKTKGAPAGSAPSGSTANSSGANRAAGGAIYGPGSSTSDSIAANLSNGEHIWTAGEVRAAGGQGAVYAMRAQVRAGKRPKFADGGAVSDAWNQSFRAAAAAYSMPTRTVQAFTSSTQVVVPPLEAALVDDRVRMDGNGHLRLIDARVSLGIQKQTKYKKKR